MAYLLLPAHWYISRTVDRHMLTFSIGTFRRRTCLDHLALPPQIRFALIILYRRIFVTNTGRRYARLIQKGAFVAVGGLLLGSITYYFSQCKPPPAAWTPGLGHCAPPRAGWLGTGIANLITDVITFSVPIVWVAGLQMSLHRKIVVSIQLFVGSM